MLGLALAFRRGHRPAVVAGRLRGGGHDRHDGAPAHAGAIAVARRGRERWACSRLLRFRQGRTRRRRSRASASARRSSPAPYVWAVAVGGEALVGPLQRPGRQRRLPHLPTRIAACSSRYTLSELLYEFPLGAGLGRWGMMQVYFGDPTLWQAPPIHVEIQPTGWLLDGGVPMWLLYGGALVMALRTRYRVAVHASATAAGRRRPPCSACSSPSCRAVLDRARCSTRSSASCSGRSPARCSERSAAPRPPERRRRGDSDA